ncbi:MAG: hypothetical protein IJW46_06665, partial [Clostridia bacterium]|nr:hypothetical protein [Clostridia bacterium]
MKKIVSVLLVVLMLSALFVPFSVHALITPSDIAYAPYAETAPVLDGEVDDVYLTAPEYALGRVVKIDSTNAGARDSSRVTFRLVHRGSYVYYLIDIVDDALISKQSDTHWKNDCLMIFFSEDCNATGFNPDNNLSYQPYVLIEDTNGEAKRLTFRANNANSMNENASEDTQYVCNVDVNEDGSYHAQLEIRMKTMHETQVTTNTYVTAGDPVVGVGTTCAIDFQFNDQDTTPNNSNNTRTIVWAWAVDNDHGPNQNKERLGHIKFVESTHNIFDSAAEWRYLTATQDPDAAPANWKTNLSATADWEVAPAPFGCRAPGCTKNWNTVQDPAITDGTCDNAYFWAVKEVVLTEDDLTALADKALLTSTFFDQSIKIYVNGHLVYSGGENNRYRNVKLADNATDILREGSNIIAVSLHQGGGGYEFDMNLYATSGDTSKFVAQTEIKDMTIKEGENYSFYYQTRANADDATATDFRILFVADLDWLASINTMEAVVSFTNGSETKTMTVTPDTVYETVSAPETVYIAPDGAVVFGWI